MLRRPQQQWPLAGHGLGRQSPRLYCWQVRCLSPAQCCVLAPRREADAPLFLTPIVAILACRCSGAHCHTFVQATQAEIYTRAVCFSAHETQLITGAEDGIIRMWNLRTAQLRHQFFGHTCVLMRGCVLISY